MRLVTVSNATRNTVLGDRIEVADASFTRLFGLLGRRGLDTGTGLWIKPSSGVHTLGMMFTIDVVGLDRDLNVLRLWPDLVPFRITSISTKLRSVVELPAGQIKLTGTQIGDLLQVR